MSTRPLHHSGPPANALRQFAVTRHSSSRSNTADDFVVREEPLEIRIGSHPLAVVMRTPGHDEELARGFLLCEGIIDSAGDVDSIRPCSLGTNEEDEDNVLRVTLQPHVEPDLEALRRNLYASSSCGVCGKASIESVLRTSGPVQDATRFPASLLYQLPDGLREAQSVFRETGGLHAAGLFDATGRLRVAREDVGRHNAVDKVIGWALASGQIPLASHVLMVSGRISFEIVQKAITAEVPVVAGISAPSSLAIELAADSNVTLVGFLRGRSLNVYSRGDRIE